MKLIVVDTEENVHEININKGQTLMRILHEIPNGVSAICGGVMACGTCHVYVDPKCLSILKEPSKEEKHILKTLDHSRDNSRLSCQIYLYPDYDDIKISIAPVD